MFKVSTYRFRYFLERIDELRIVENPPLIPFFQPATRTTNSIVGMIKDRQRFNGKFMCNIQINYQNHLTQDIFTNMDDNEGITFRQEGVLLNTQTVLGDMFFVFCFTDLPFNLNDRQRQDDEMNGMMFVFYDGRSTLLPTAIRMLNEHLLEGFISDIVPIFRNTIPLTDALHFIKGIHIKGLLDRDRRRTGMNIMISREMLEQDFGLLEQVEDYIQQLMGQTLGEIRYTAQVFGRRVPIVRDAGIRVLQSVPEILQLSERIQEHLDDFTLNFNHRGRNFDFANQLGQLTELILNDMGNHN